MGPSHRARRGAALQISLVAAGALVFGATPAAVGLRAVLEPSTAEARLYAREIELPALRPREGWDLDALIARSREARRAAAARARLPGTPHRDEDDGAEELDAPVPSAGPSALASAGPSGLASAGPSAGPSAPAVDDADEASAVDTPDDALRDEPLAPPGALASASASALEPEPDELDEAGSIDPSLPSAMRCTTRRRGLRVERALAFCGPDYEAQVRAYAPDTIVVLGGGLVFGGDPGCATSQRALAAWQLFERLEGRVNLLLSGRGPVEPLRDLDDALFACERARRARRLEASRARRPDRVHEDERSLARLDETRRAAPTEATQMCAALLRRYPSERWGEVLARVYFEAQSRTTVENVRFSTPLLRSLGAERVLVLSTPVPGRHVDNHPARALYGFVALRGERDRYRLGALGCPYEHGGPAWSFFEADDARDPERLAAARRARRRGT